MCVQENESSFMQRRHRMVPLAGDKADNGARPKTNVPPWMQKMKMMNYIGHLTFKCHSKAGYSAPNHSSVPLNLETSIANLPRNPPNCGNQSTYLEMCGLILCTPGQVISNIIMINVILSGPTTLDMDADCGAQEQ